MDLDFEGEIPVFVKLDSSILLGLENVSIYEMAIVRLHNSPFSESILRVLDYLLEKSGFDELSLSQKSLARLRFRAKGHPEVLQWIDNHDELEVSTYD